MYSMSVIARLELDELVDFPAAALLNFRRLRYVIWNNTTLYPKISNILAPHRMSALPPFFFRNITCLEIVNIDDFPAVLISYCHALKDLNLANMTFLDPDAAPTPSTLPYIDDLYVSTYNIEMIQTLVDRVVDLSRLQQLHDRMSLDMKYEVEEFEKDEEIIECHRHLLSKSKNSLTKLFLTCRAYSQIVCIKLQCMTYVFHSIPELFERRIGHSLPFVWHSRSRNTMPGVQLPRRRWPIGCSTLFTRPLENH